MTCSFEPLENRTMFSVVSVATLDPNASEAGQDPASFFVYRQDRAPIATRVYFTVGGTATSPLNSLKAGFADYTGIHAPPPPVIQAFAGTARAAAAIGIVGGNTGYVDIPAGQTYAVVTITPVDDTRVESLETATFTLKPDAEYQIGSSSTVALSIHDNDGPVVANDIADSYLRDGNSANTNFGHSTHLEVKKGPIGFNRATLIKFDLSHLDPLAGYGHVTLKVFGSLSNTNQKNVVTNVLPFADSSWSETDITWNHRPIIFTRGDSTLSTATIIDNTPRWYTWDVTSFVKSELAAGHTACTLVLRNMNDSDPIATFNSREASGNHPQLVFTA
ncbi:MAG TPA: DNRLRE domain-containing protein [Tepidisphaeraceae bacterium]|nr:DNRLRE domain-containing protein [Tepidisphaeraceae bacterium]